MNRDAVPPEELDIPEEIIFAGWLACVRRFPENKKFKAPGFFRTAAVAPRPTEKRERWQAR